MQHFSTNLTPTSHSDTMFRLFMTLASAGWQTIAWSDGTTAHNTPISNPYPYSSGTIGFGNANQVDAGRAWIVMQQPPTSASLTVGAPWAGTRQLGWQRSSGDRRQWRIKYSMSGAYTNPSVAGTGQNMPSQNTGINDEAFIAGGGSDSSPTFDFAFAGTDGGSRVNIMADDGYLVSGSNPTPYGYYMTSFTNGAGNGCEAEQIFDPLLSGSFPPGDTDPFMIGRHSTNINNSVFNPYTAQQHFGDSTTSGVHRCWFAKGKPTQQFVGCASLYFLRGNNSQGMVNAYPQQAGANQHSNEDDLLPIIQARYASTGGQGGYKGLSSLMRYTSSIKSTGTAMSVASNRDRIVMNTVTLPWDGSLPLV